jgi:hypothetical protein
LNGELTHHLGYEKHSARLPATIPAIPETAPARKLFHYFNAVGNQVFVRADECLQAGLFSRLLPDLEVVKTVYLKLVRCITETGDAQFAMAKAFSPNNSN